MSGPIVTQRQLSEHLISGGKTRQTSIVPELETSSVRKQLLLREKMMTPVRKPVSPPAVLRPAGQLQCK